MKMTNIIGVTAIGVVARIIFVLTSAKHPADPFFVADPYAYLLMAEHAFHGHWFVSFRGFPTSYLSVGYPALIALTQRLVMGLFSTWVVALFLNIASFVATALAVARLVPVLCGRLSMRTGAVEAASVIAVGILAFDPDFVFATGLVMTELVAVAFLSWALVLVAPRVTGDASGASNRNLAAASVLFGLTVFVRPSMVLLVVAVPLLLAARRDIRGALLCAVLAAVPVAPLVWNNVRVGAGIGVTSATWPNVCDGLVNRHGEFEWRRECRVTLLPGETVNAGTEARNTEWARKISVLEIKNGPGRWISRMPLRLWHSMWPGGWATQFSVKWAQNYAWTPALRAFLWLSRAYFAFVAAAGILQVARMLSRRAMVWWPIALVSVGSLSGVPVSFGQSRFGWPLAVLGFVPLASLLVSEVFTGGSSATNSLGAVVK